MFWLQTSGGRRWNDANRWVSPIRAIPLYLLVRECTSVQPLDFIRYTFIKYFLDSGDSIVPRLASDVLEQLDAVYSRLDFEDDFRLTFVNTFSDYFLEKRIYETEKICLHDLIYKLMDTIEDNIPREKQPAFYRSFVSRMNNMHFFYRHSWNCPRPKLCQCHQLPEAYSI